MYIVLICFIESEDKIVFIQNIVYTLFGFAFARYDKSIPYLRTVKSIAFEVARCENINNNHNNYYFYHYHCSFCYLAICLITRLQLYGCIVVFYFLSWQLMFVRLCVIATVELISQYVSSWQKLHAELYICLYRSIKFIIVVFMLLYNCVKVLSTDPQKHFS